MDGGPVGRGRTGKVSRTRGSRKQALAASGFGDLRSTSSGGVARHHIEATNEAPVPCRRTLLLDWALWRLAVSSRVPVA